MEGCGEGWGVPIRGERAAEELRLHRGLGYCGKADAVLGSIGFQGRRLIEVLETSRPVIELRGHYHSELLDDNWRWLGPAKTHERRRSQ
jgi:hypothetical protein